MKKITVSSCWIFIALLSVLASSPAAAEKVRRLDIVDKAIEFHGGEAQTVRDNYLALSNSNQRAVLAFLRKLRTPRRPNEDLLPLQ